LNETKLDLNKDTVEFLEIIKGNIQKEKDDLSNFDIVQSRSDSNSTYSFNSKGKLGPRLSGMMGSLGSDKGWPEDAIGMIENTKLILNEKGFPIQLITRLYKMKDGSEKKVVTTEAL